MSFTKQVSLHGRRAYISDSDKLVSKSAFATGGEAAQGRQGGSIVLPGGVDVVAYFNDFLGDTGYLAGFTRMQGDTDSGATSTAAKVAGSNGVFRLSHQGTPLRAPSMAIGISQVLKQWKPNAGNLHMQARVKIPSLASVNAFIGFTDSGGSEMPAYDTGGGIITEAADAVGFAYSNLGGVTNWRVISARSVAADSGDQSLDTAKAPTANTYDVLGLQFSADSGEYVDAYVNGAKVGRISQPTNAATALNFGVWVFGSDTGTIQVDVDYVNISANRDTGA